MAGSQDAEIHYCTLDNGDEEVVEPGGTVSHNESVLGGSVVNGHEES